MARLAAAGYLVWAVLLTSGVLGAAGFTTLELLLIEKWFPQGSLPPPVQLYSKANPKLNAAVSGDKVVLAASNCHDPYQKWYVLPSPFCYFYGDFYSFYSCVKSFSLLNAATGKIIVVPKDGSVPKDGPVLLSQTLDLSAAAKELWTQGPRDAYGFSQMFPGVYPYGSKALNDGVGKGTEVGIYSSSPIYTNTLWKIEPFPFCFP
ncbi:hypothetical protein ACP70R_021138 [Stipagrostis hirtigluma subsp. patula]